MQRELGYKVYLKGYGGEGKGRMNEGKRWGKERDRSCLSRRGQTQREQAREAEGGTLLAKAVGGGFGVGGACLLKGQGIQVTDLANRLQQACQSGTGEMA